MSEKMKNIVLNIKNSFILASKGQEILPIVIWWWGVLSYLLAYLISKILDFTHIKFITNLTAILVIIYYIWHIFAIYKCSPKKPKLTAEEKAKLKLTAGDRLKSFGRKIFLQESITKWNSSSFLIAIDLYIIAVFSGYPLK